MTIQNALSAFYDANDFGDDGGEKSAVAWIKFGPISLPIPNPESRKEVLLLHDVHHLITQNGTDWKGESAVSAWEIATGGWGSRIYIWLIIFGGLIVGIFRFPTNTLNAFVAGLRSHSLIGLKIQKKDLLKLSIEEVQSKTGLLKVSDKPATFAEKMSYLKWCLIAVTSWLIIFGTMVLFGYFLIKKLG